MTLEGLRMFCAVLEERSFRAAALRMHRSQPAISQQIKALEEETGHRLIERRGCVPTPVGKQLHHRAREIVAATDNVMRELGDLAEGQTQELRVGTSDTTALYVLPPVVRAFSDAMPQTRLVITNSPSAVIADRVSRGELDLGIVTLPVSHEDLEAEDLFVEKLLVVMPRSHRLSVRKRVRLAELEDEPLLLLHGETRTGALLRDHFRRSEFEPQVALRTGSFEVIKRYVAEGVGLSFLPEMVVTTADRTLATATVPSLPTVRIGAIRRRHAYQTVAAQRFLEFVSNRNPVARTQRHRTVWSKSLDDGQCRGVG